MQTVRRLGLVLLLLAVTSLSCVTTGSQSALVLTNVQTCRGISDDQKPVGVTSAFEAGTEVVYCWFSWEGADPNTKLVSRWYYVPENLHVIDVATNLVRNSASAVFVLRMPREKPLPSGMYKIDLIADGTTIETVRFNVAPATPSQ